MAKPALQIVHVQSDAASRRLELVELSRAANIKPRLMQPALWKVARPHQPSCNVKGAHAWQTMVLSANAGLEQLQSHLARNFYEAVERGLYVEHGESQRSCGADGDGHQCCPNTIRQLQWGRGKIHPECTTKRTIEKFKQQIKSPLDCDLDAHSSQSSHANNSVTRLFD